MLSLDFGICDQGITKTGVVSETATALTANEVTNAFKEGQGRIGGFAAKDFPDGDGEMYTWLPILAVSSICEVTI